MFNRRASQARHFQSRGGNVLPRLSTDEVTTGLADALRPIYAPLKKPAEALAADSGTNARTARNHLSGANCMNLTDFFNACRAIPELQQWGMKMMGVQPVDPNYARDLDSLMRAFYAIQSRNGGE